jgi:lipopolysaccharide transport system permease protein
VEIAHIRLTCVAWQRIFIRVNADRLVKRMMNQQDQNMYTVVLEPTKGWQALRLGELWKSRELIWFLTWRDIKVRYKQTVLGAGWAVLQPLITMVIFTFIFGGLARMPSDGVPYPLFSYAALVPWAFYSGTITKAANSLITNGGMIKKIYFPRLVLPISAMLATLVDFFIAFAVLIIMLVAYIMLTPVPIMSVVLQHSPALGGAYNSSVAITANVVWLPALLLLAAVSSLGASLWLSALNVQYRDVRFAVPFLIQILQWVTPIAYPSTLVSEPLKTVMALNPMTGVVEGFRWALLDTATVPDSTLMIAAVSSTLILISGAYVFRRIEKTFADVV